MTTTIIKTTSVPYVIQMTEKTPTVIVLNSGGGVSTTTGGTVQTIQGPPGPQGEQGLPGLPGSDGKDGKDGKDGTSVVLKGAVASIENLPSSDQTQGDLYVVTDDGNGYVWDGSQWVSCGPIRGPQGEPGEPGANGSDGADGRDGQNGLPGVNGSSAYIYVAYASDLNGTGFTTTFNASLDYIAIKSTTTPLSPPVANQFTGLWKKYKGETGVKGDTGATGGIDFSTFWKFSWNENTEYNAYEGVERNGSAYISKQANTGQDPALDTDEVYWGLWVAKGDSAA